ncbi:MAG: serine hydrolase [Colwellia sp.]
MNIKLLLIIATVLLMQPSAYCSTKVLSAQEVDRIVNRAMEKFSVLGVAVGITQNGKVLLSKGYGLNNVNTAQKINDLTLFKIASTTKAFTAAALAILVDQGKLKWDSKVVDIIPNFALYDPWVTKEFTIIDLLTHRSGLARYAGDLMLWPEPAGFSRDEIINNIKFLKPASSFRSEYAYDNLLYIVAGEIIPHLTGQSWEDFVEQNIFHVLGMNNCFAGPVDKNFMANIAQPHGLIDNTLQVIERSQTYDKYSVLAAAGGIKCSVKDLLNWVETQLNRGLSKKGVRLFSEKQSEIMWQPQTILSVSKEEKTLDNTNFKSYGLGWRLADMHGFKRVSHTGSLSGNISMITMIPELNLGVIVLLNQNAYHARKAIMDSIVKSFMQVKKLDWIDIHFKKRQKRLQNIQQEQAKNKRITKEETTKIGKSSISLSSFIGTYQDPWFGQVNISIIDEQLYFQSLKSIRMKGKMTVKGQEHFLVRWDDRTLEADAVVNFNLDSSNNAQGFTMEPNSSTVDASFDYIDLIFTRIIKD